MNDCTYNSNKTLGMNKRSTILMAICTTAILLAGATQVQAVPVVVSWGGQKITKVAAYPDTEKFKTQDGNHVDVGYRYKQIALFFIPFLNYDGHWCGYVGNSDRYLDLSKDQLDALAYSAGLSLPATPSLPFWDSSAGARSTPEAAAPAG
jgi:hypothetical protein